MPSCGLVQRLLLFVSFKVRNGNMGDLFMCTVQFNFISIKKTPKLLKPQTQEGGNATEAKAWHLLHPLSYKENIEKTSQDKTGQDRTRRCSTSPLHFVIRPY